MMWQIILCNGIKHNIRVMRIMWDYEKAVNYALKLKAITGKQYKVERV